MGEYLVTVDTYIIGNIIISCILLLNLYHEIYEGGFIIKRKQNFFSIVYIIALVLWSYTAVRSLIDYLGGKNIDAQEILQITMQIQTCILWILIFPALGKTKNDIYSDESILSYFAKSKRIKNYSWTSDNIVEFEIFTRKNSIISTELEVDQEQREEVDKFLSENIKKIDKATNKKRIFKLRMITILIAIVMAIGHINLIKINKPYMTKQVNLNEDEAADILKKTWKPLIELEKEGVNSREDFHKAFRGTMSESMIEDLYEMLVDTDKSTDGKIKFYENVRIPTIYDTKISIKKSYIKSPKYKELSKEANMVEELIIEESGKLDEGGPLSSFKRESTFIKNDDGNWILDRIRGLESIRSQ